MNRYIALFVLLFVGCEKYVETDSSPIQAPSREYMLVFVLDTSGSFTTKMFEGDGLGYTFFLKASDQFFRDRMGADDRIVISQLSANTKTLLWEGTPLSLRKRFGNAQSLQEYITQRSDPAGSRVYAAVADTLDYVCELPGVTEGDTEVCVLVLSDMLDNSPTQEEDQQRMVDALRRISQANCAIGFYWVEQFRLSECRQCLLDAGIQDSVVECEIVDEPQLPAFD